MSPRRQIAGTSLGRYTLLKQLATGGTTEVLLARASGMQSFEHHVVIKRLTARPDQDPQVLAMFLDEARLAASLHHHHIVQVHDLGQEGDDYFFAMEYVHGEDLRRLLLRAARDGVHLPLEQIVTIVLAVAAALHHAHEQKAPDGQPLDIVHRDVSPANILVGYDGNVKVVDFGIAKAALRTSQTRSGTLRGKAAYMAPEQCMGREVDRRSDVFALGIVLYELVTVRRLFKAGTDFLTMSSIVAGKFPPPSQFRPDLPTGLEHVILEALAPSPDTRFQTAEELGLALEDFAAANGMRMSTTALADYMTRQFGTRPEPWRVDGDVLVDSSDDDFDHEMPSALAGDPPPPRLPSELPVDAELDDETDEAGTELMDEAALAAVLADARSEQKPDPKLETGDATTLAGRTKRPRPSFDEGEEKTAIADNDASSLLVEMSKIDKGAPRRDTLLPLAAEPEPIAQPRSAAPPRRDTPRSAIAPPPPPPAAVTRAVAPDAGPAPPVAWATQSSQVTSLTSKTRWYLVLVALALALVIASAIGLSGLFARRAASAPPAPDAAMPDAGVDASPPDASAPPVDARRRAPKR